MPIPTHSTTETTDAPTTGAVAPERFPGWYLDPRNAGDERFWNGTEWTNLTRAAPRLTDYLGPIEPTLLAILGETDTNADQNEPAQGDPGQGDPAQANTDLSQPAPDLASHVAMTSTGNWDDRSALDQVVAFMAN